MTSYPWHDNDPITVKQFGTRADQKKLYDNLAPKARERHERVRRNLQAAFPTLTVGPGLILPPNNKKKKIDHDEQS